MDINCWSKQPMTQGFPRRAEAFGGISWPHDSAGISQYVGRGCAQERSRHGLWKHGQGRLKDRSTGLRSTTASIWSRLLDIGKGCLTIGWFVQGDASNRALGPSCKGHAPQAGEWLRLQHSDSIYAEELQACEWPEERTDARDWEGLVLHTNILEIVNMLFPLGSQSIPTTPMFP